jgi:predicted RNA-binding Zn-ribbon protein involved in translation (DUF1610 family)
MFRDLVLRRWANFEGEKPVGWLKEDWESKIDPGVLDRASDGLWAVGFDGDAGDDVRTAARCALEPNLARGLVRREHHFVRPVAIVKPEMLNDWQAWVALKTLYERVGGDVADVRCEHWGEVFHLVVCDACSAVFRPKRRVYKTRRCHLCRHRPAAPALGTPETTDAMAAGWPVTISVPERVGSVVTSWKTRTLFRCPECGEPTFARNEAQTCSKPGCQSRHRRRIA